MRKIKDEIKDRVKYCDKSLLDDIKNCYTIKSLQLYDFFKKRQVMLPLKDEFIGFDENTIGQLLYQLRRSGLINSYMILGYSVDNMFIHQMFYPENRAEFENFWALLCPSILPVRKGEHILITSVDGKEFVDARQVFDFLKKYEDTKIDYLLYLKNDLPGSVVEVLKKEYV